ncbi:hypothetical protein Fleli_0099 [Bernardetia litoralis DSM 6794]|uniref:STAS/SEC14 domain-containing protein n=1 Tax=Bernardetia litoralis (strain ATCC 23117 / DSM 6794 / NBRC 15988 / NCIMB 1366 / Fx l1 / Sio-4) TaxID=880071 RepID=I4AF67_BERLS|nr:hypothetical protein [Bernardetia litoralis]AFM02602.1 hypothetical protein Fleli_0099 [Bernardetia litoralis DSM 6794]
MAGSYQVNHIENQKGNYIKVEMKGFLVLEKYQPCWLEVLDLIEKNQTNKLLVDMSQSKVIAEENRDWLKEVYFPKAYQVSNAKFFKVARIVAEDIYNQMSLKQLDTMRNEGDYSEESKNFKTEDEALNWLLA